MPSITRPTIEPLTLEWMKPDFSIVFTRTSQIDRMMGTVEISAPEDHVSTLSEAIHIFRELSVKYEFILPGLLAFSTIWEVDPENIDHLPCMRELEMSNTSLTRRRVSLETIEKSICHLREESLVDPDSRTRISWLFSRIVVGRIVFWCLEFWGDFIVSCLDLLHEEYIRIVGFEELRELSFICCGTDAIHIPGDDTHREKYYLSIEKIILKSRKKSIHLTHTLSSRLITLDRITRDMASIRQVDEDTSLDRICSYFSFGFARNLLSEVIEWEMWYTEHTTDISPGFTRELYHEPPLREEEWWIFPREISRGSADTLDPAIVTRLDEMKTSEPHREEISINK